MSAFISSQSRLLVSEKANTYKLFISTVSLPSPRSQDFHNQRSSILTPCLFQLCQIFSLNARTIGIRSILTTCLSPVSFQLYTVRALRVREGQYLRPFYSTPVRLIATESSQYQRRSLLISCSFHLRQFLFLRSQDS
jgi:hypothetical protein